jgi:hypothetical protein
MTRKWFQIHLSTAMVLMFLAGGLLWLNLRDSRELGSMISSEKYQGQDVYQQAVEYKFGWPFTIHEGLRPLQPRAHQRGDQVFIWNEPELDLLEPASFDGHWVWKGLALNALFTLALLAAIALLIESIFRRREPNL